MKINTDSVVRLDGHYFGAIVITGKYYRRTVVIQNNKVLYKVKMVGNMKFFKYPKTKNGQNHNE